MKIFDKPYFLGTVSLLFGELHIEKPLEPEQDIYGVQAVKLVILEQLAFRRKIFPGNLKLFDKKPVDLLFYFFSAQTHLSPRL